jgi:peptidoglycan/xylan/chitin deacetylase (PgdA/CDA1 family)
VRVVSPILKRAVYPCLANSGFLRRRAHGGGFCVVTYHGILPQGYRITDEEQDGSLISAQIFREQLRLLKRNYCVVSPEQVREWLVDGKELPERAVLITCDDGLKNALTDMVPILREEEISCLFFVLGISGREEEATLWYEDMYWLLLVAPAGSYVLDEPRFRFTLQDRKQRRAIWWSLVKKFSQFAPLERERQLETLRVSFESPERRRTNSANHEVQRQRFSLLNVNELRQLANLGMSIGSHTLTHPVLSQQNSESAWLEISESRGLLEQATGKQVWALAYPFGDPASVGAREMQMAEQAGFKCAFVNTDGGFGASLPRFALPRIHVTAKMALTEFEAHVSGFYRDFRSRMQLGAH